MPDDPGALPEGTPPPVEEGAPLWVVTFSDLMSLLLTFFILLFSMSELKMDKFLLASQSLREAMGGTAVEAIDDPMGLLPDPVDPELHMENAGLQAGASQGASEGLTDGVLRGGSESVGNIGEQSVSEILATQYLKEIVERLTSFIAENNLEETLLITKEASGVRLRIDASALFRPGVGTVEPDSEWIIEFLADLTGEMEVPVIVVGHADNQPINNDRFGSNWELSAVRAAGVARHLIDLGHDPLGVRVESFGEYHPVATNETVEGRARNRRVEFFYSRRDIVSTIEQWRRDLRGR